MLGSNPDVGELMGFVTEIKGQGMDRLVALLRFSIVGSLSVVLLSACGLVRNDLPPAPTSAEVAQISPDYRLGPLDEIEVFVWRSPELSSSVPVRPDGRISLPLIEDMQAAGKTPTELARDIEESLKVYVNEPIVTVIVNGFRGSFSQQVRVVGETQDPQALPYRTGMTILDVLIAVGGLTEFADGNNAVLVRYEGGEEIAYSILLDDLIKYGDIKANVPVLPGDVIIIPEAWL